jgi:acyl-CoA thioesterase FadM
MYPYCRITKLIVSSKRKSKCSYSDEGILKMRVMPGDIDVFGELNNGRFLTLMDFGRFDLAIRTGLLKFVRKQNWGLTVAGSTARFRYRLRLFQKFELHSKVIGHDDKWIYFHQKMIRKGKIHASALVRTGVTSKDGIVKVEEVKKRMDQDLHIPILPAWAKAWIEADEIHPKS